MSEDREEASKILSGRNKPSAANLEDDDDNEFSEDD
jgi:hypothetical protein